MNGKRKRVILFTLNTVIIAGIFGMLAFMLLSNDSLKNMLNEYQKADTVTATLY